MPNIFVTGEDVSISPPIIGYRIMQLLEENDSNQISIFDITDKFKNEKWFSSRQLYLGMLFLFSVGLIEFNQPYIVKHA